MVKAFSKKFRGIILLFFFLSFVPFPVGDVIAEGTSIDFPYNPYISVLPADNQSIAFWDWELGSLVTFSIDDPSTSDNPDFTSSVVIGPSEDYPGQPFARFELSNVFQVQPGYIVTASDGNITKTHEVLALIYTEFDVENDLVYGKGVPNSEITVWACTALPCVYRGLNTDSEGFWMADFSTFSDNGRDTPDTFDLVEGTPIGSWQDDEDHDCTEYLQAIPWNIAYDPYFIVLPSNAQGIDLWGWELGEIVTVTIDDPGTSETPDFSADVSIDTIHPQAYQTYRRFDLQDLYSVEPGYIVNVSDEAVTKTHEVIGIEFTGYDLDNDLIFVKGVPNSSIAVWACSSSMCVYRGGNTDSDGLWTADFSTFSNSGSDTQSMFDIVKGSGIGSSQGDNDGDRTEYGTAIPSPNMVVRIIDDVITANDWNPGSEIILTVEDPNTLRSPDYSEQISVGSEPPSFWLSGIIDLQAGLIVEITDGSMTASQVLTNLAFSQIDWDQKMVFGIAPAGSIVNVTACDYTCSSIQVTTGFDGEWMADFDGIHDFSQTTWLMADQTDDDGDRMEAYPPVIGASAGLVEGYDGYLGGYGWDSSSVLHITVDDPSTIEMIDFETYYPVGTGGRIDDYQLDYGDFILKADQIVTISDIQFTNSYRIPVLSIEVVDQEGDIVYGKADPNVLVEGMIRQPEGNCWRYTYSDANGDWSLDYSVPGSTIDEFDICDIKGGSNVAVKFSQRAGETYVMMDESIDLNPYILVEPYYDLVTGFDHVNGYDWKPGIDVTVTIDDPSTSSSIDYQETITTNENGIIETTPPLNIGAGFVVTMTDGITIKSLVVSNIHATADESTNVVSGVATPYANIFFWIENSEISSWIQTEPDGNWSTDLDGVYTLATMNQYGGINEYDADGDVTYYFWRVQHPTVEAWVSENSLKIFDWPLLADLNISIDDPSTIAAPDFETQRIATPNPWFEGSLVYLKFQDDFPLAPGMLVTVTGGGITDNLTISTLQITGVNVENETVTGFTDPISPLIVYLGINGVTRSVTSDNNGFWEADFKGTDYIETGRAIYAYVSDDDRDSTIYEYIVGDADRDGFLDDVDNAPFIFNPDQGDIDGDGIADVLDGCPNDFENQCATDGSAVMVIGPEGGQFTTPNGAITFIVPAGQLSDWTTFSVTAHGSGISIGTSEGELTSIYTGDFQPDGFSFQYPDFATLIFRWSDSDDDGIVDGTNIAESDLLVVRDGMIISNYCGDSPDDCDVVNNQFRVLIGHFCTVSLAGIQNTPPIITQFDASILPVAISTSTTATIEYSDPDENDLHAIVFDWGDGTSSSGTIDEATHTGFGSHEYSVPGVYTVTALLSDSHDANTTKDFVYIVVFDPTGGFVTGGGWIDVPTGSLLSDSSATGKMIFGFEAKYLKNTSIPTGKTNLTFKTGGFFFDSTAYTWMTVSGDKVIIRGVGNTNGESGYGFQINAIDGNVFSSGQDLIRIRVWDLQTGYTIFDTQSGDYAFSDPDLSISGGSIQIHK